MIIPITAIVIDTDSYDLVLGNTWLRKVRAILDFGALKMQFTWKGRTFDVAIDIHRGIRPRFIDDEEDGEYNIVQVTNKPPRNERRYLTTEECNEVMAIIIQDQWCSYCGSRVYCAEMMCDCPTIFKMKIGISWKDQFPRDR